MGWSHTGRTLTVQLAGGAQLAAGSYQRERERARSSRRYAAAPSAQLGAGEPDGDRATAGAQAAAADAGPDRRRSPGYRRPPRRSPTGRCSRSPALTTSAVRKIASGRPRDGYTHQGQDVLTAEGTPVVVAVGGHDHDDELSGGRRRVLRGRAHRRGVRLHVRPLRGEFAGRQLGPGCSSAGQALCKAGQTGDATAPHLHFEMWVGGWQARGRGADRPAAVPGGLGRGLSRTGWREADSNRRHHDFQSCALPAELSRRDDRCYRLSMPQRLAMRGAAPLHSGYRNRTRAYALSFRRSGADI